MGIHMGGGRLCKVPSVLGEECPLDNHVTRSVSLHYFQRCPQAVICLGTMTRFKPPSPCYTVKAEHCWPGGGATMMEAIDCSQRQSGSHMMKIRGLGILFRGGGGHFLYLNAGCWVTETSTKLYCFMSWSSRHTESRVCKITLVFSVLCQTPVPCLTKEHMDIVPIQCGVLT